MTQIFVSLTSKDEELVALLSRAMPEVRSLAFLYRLAVVPSRPSVV
jgi:hypothetical protein